jgi:NitT/TauT family transport system ATP-binding protein
MAKSMRDAPKLEVRDVCMRFRRQGADSDFEVLNSISFCVYERERYSLVGPSGCGKTTLLNIIAGFERPTTGEVLVDGAPVRGPAPSRAVVFQEDALFPWLTALDNVRFGPCVRGRRESADKWKELLKTVGLEGFDDYYPAQLSGGMRQRVAVARALANEPAVLLMDEPFGALDALTRTQMHEWLLELWRRFRFTVVFVTHDIDEAILLSDRVGVMAGAPGRLIGEVEIKLGEPRKAEVTVSSEFAELKGRVLELLGMGWRGVGNVRSRS